MLVKMGVLVSGAEMDEHQRVVDGDCGESGLPVDFLEEVKGATLNELGGNLSQMFGVLPVVATAVCEHVFQELASQFFERGAVYIPNFGWIVYDKGGTKFVGSAALSENCLKITKAMKNPSFTLAGWEMKSRGIDSWEKWNGLSSVRGILEPRASSPEGGSPDGGSLELCSGGDPETQPPAF